MKIIDYDKEKFENYKNDLRMIGSLSYLFADSDVPMLDYRVPENIYCMSFNAKNLARSCVTADAKLGDIGIGIKTFLENNKKTWQKIAEFDKKANAYNNLSSKEMVMKISELRNERIVSTMKTYGIKKLIYHCVVRNKKGFHFYEEYMDMIDLNNIKNITEKRNTIYFSDGKHEYSFNKTKSTLLKRFYIDSYFDAVDVIIAENPIDLLRNSFDNIIVATEKEKAIIPLYSYKNGVKFVPEKSGLNQWNASGRKRDFDEVYIPFPADLRKKYQGFFPSRDKTFKVKLPSGKTILMKICQENGKAIMSNPNKDLGAWILRDVLQMKKGEIVTYDKLSSIGIDSVVFDKVEADQYNLDFKKIDLNDE